MTPNKLHLHKKTQILDIQFANSLYCLSAEYLRVHSPSAEVKGHNGTGGQLPFGKRDVRIEKLELTGNYAVRIYFDDGHSSGLYSWNYLYELAINCASYWQTYLDKLHENRKSRDQDTSVLTIGMANDKPSS
jgi:DUF971 family protein